jgi:hypothetical protein
MTDDVLGDGARLLDAMNRAEFERAKAKIGTAPIDLTDRDFQLLKAYGGDQLEGEAWEAQRLAVRALLPPAPAPTSTKSVKAPKAPPETIAEFVERYGHKTVTYKALAGQWDVFTDVLKHHKEKIDTLTEQNKTLSDRVLELEAQRAAVGHETR